MNSNHQAYPAGGPRALGLCDAVQRARRSPFMAEKLRRAAIGADGPRDWDAWRAIPPTTKQELRELGSFEEQFCTAPREQIVEFWRSGGVTGRPLFYPRTAPYIDQALDTFARSLRIAGLTARDTFMCSLPIGIHPAGQQMARAAERVGAATLWAGAGNQTPSAAQIELLHDLRVTVWCGMPSFGLHLGHLAEATGRPLSASPVHTLVTTAEALSDSKRALLSRLWGARVVDTFGMSEICLLAVECGRRPGLHVFTDIVFCEVLDPTTLDPVPPGEIGVLCATSLFPFTPTPFVRWLSGDIVRMEAGCECAQASEPRLIHSGRTTDFFKVKGVNLNHAELEEALYAIPDLRDYQVVVTDGDLLVVRVECADGCDVPISHGVDRLLVERFGLRGEIVLLERGTIAKATEGQIKAQRFVDQRSNR